MYRIVEEPIDLAALVRLVADPGAGAVVTFSGTTRNESGGRPVRSLTYEAYPEMAERKLGEIGREARERHEILRIAIHHRVGTLPVGEVSVGIAVSAPHRAPAFAACRFAIERIKEDLPVWKKERFADGTEEWVGAPRGAPDR